nr:MAG TPA: hypothetical protein [Bacteriophage sp.]
MWDVFNLTPYHILFCNEYYLLRYQCCFFTIVEWCITGGDLYFLAGLVMYHSGVVNDTPETFLSARVVERVGFAGNHSIHAGLDVSGGTRRLWS